MTGLRTVGSPSPQGSFAVAVGADSGSPARAREVIKTLGLPRPVEDDALLLTSELVSNSVLHAEMVPRDAILLKVESWPDRLRVAVRDPGRSGERPALLPTEAAHGGWGMRLVERLSDGWGVVERPACTCVWFELAIGR